MSGCFYSSCLGFVHTAVSWAQNSLVQVCYGVFTHPPADGEQNEYPMESGNAGIVCTQGCAYSVSVGLRSQKPATRHHFAPVKMAVAKTMGNHSVSRMCRNRNAHALLAGADRAAAVEESLAVPGKLKHDPTVLLLYKDTREMKTRVHVKTCTPKSRATQSTAAKR